MNSTVISIIILVICAYLLGSIPSAVWIGKHYYGIDVREHGSKNAGTTNTLRVLGKRAAIPVFIIDFLKGFLAVALAILLAYDPEIQPNFIINVKIGLVFAAVLGHIFPIFADFRGGKGVATMAGAVVGIYPPAILLCLIVWFFSLMITHYVSFSSMLAGVMYPIFIMISPRTNGSISLIIFSMVVAILLIYTHRKNIKRLMAGEESKIYIFPPKDTTKKTKKE
ncbi:MAG: glycerol-3-phosphate 1-O-acyltransferase PlsY [Rikenellaceae bacterium]|nr:glycerol-3-phosphate 1-O-acyltransferase PlsY [Rikenellaceae bacterium]